MSIQFSKNTEMVLGQHGGPVVEAGTRFAAPIREPLSHLAEGMSVMGVREICDDCGSQRPRPSGADTVISSVLNISAFSSASHNFRGW